MPLTVPFVKIGVTLPLSVEPALSTITSSFKLMLPVQSPTVIVSLESVTRALPLPINSAPLIVEVPPTLKVAAPFLMSMKSSFATMVTPAPIESAVIVSMPPRPFTETLS